MKTLKSKIDSINAHIDNVWAQLDRLADSFFDQYTKDDGEHASEFGEPGTEKIRRKRPAPEKKPYSDKDKPRRKKPEHRHED